MMFCEFTKAFGRRLRQERGEWIPAPAEKTQKINV